MLKLHPLVIAFLFVCTLPNPTALAQKPPAEEEMEKAAKRFGEAEAFFRVQDYTKALEGYKEAYLLSKAPELLYNIGQCQRKLGRYEEAIESYKSFLAGAPDASNRTDVEALIVELEAKEKPQSKSPHKLLYAGAGAFGGIGLVLGGLSISAGRKAGELGEINNGESADLAEIQRLLTKSRRLGFAADSLVVMALISGGAGFILGRSNKENKEPSAVLSLSLTGATLSVQF